MTESALYNAIIGEHSRAGTRLWRTNAGMAYQGQVIERTPTRLVLAPWYPVKLGHEGMSDLIGWTTTEYIHEYNTSREERRLAALFTAIECKYGRRKETEAQANFLELVRRMGGRAGVARSVDDAGRIIRGEV
jgi:hypothetical protein